MTRNTFFSGGIAVVLGIVALSSVACSVTTLSPSAGSAPAEGEGSGDIPLSAYTDAPDRVSLSIPSTWSKTSDNPLTFTGQDEYISLTVQQMVLTDLLAAIEADASTVVTSNPGYKELGRVKSKEVANSAVLSYEWDLAASAITGKPVRERADRYYIALGDGRLVILTGSSPSNRFDREQVRDIALTVKTR